MVLVKIGRRIPREGIHLKKYSGSDIDVLRQEEGIVLGEDSVDESDDCELTNVGCELGMIDGQLCNIPYDLFDLPDLKEILSLESWNSCLTEKERFFLSAFLPDMDRQTFWLTMKELLSGKNIFFGSPLTMFFERGKSGFYPPHVTCFRGGLQFLQKRVFYHSLKSYHDNMSQTFSDMKRAWSKCPSSVDVEERIRIWKSWKNQRAMNGVDLNAFPEDVDLLDNSNIGAVIDPSSMALAPPKLNAKGVLKIKAKPADVHPMQTGMVCRPTPKGVLKVVSRSLLSQLHEPRAMLAQQEPPASVDALGSQTCRLSPAQSRSRWDAENYYKESLHQSILGGKAYKSIEASDCFIGRQRVELLDSTTEPSGSLCSSVRRIKFKKDPRLDVQGGNLFSKISLTGKKYSHENAEFRAHLNGKNHWRDMGQQDMEYYHDPMEKQITPMHDKQISLYPRTSEAVSRILGIGTGLATSLDQSKGMHRDTNREWLQDKQPVSKVLRDDATLPITYKRRKAYKKVDTGDRKSVV